MGKINVLGFEIANLIAAGEVVDRPASVVKELCENSIDAGATSITVEIRRGGTSYIRVSDNGCGIESDDLPLTVLRHATSKISKAEDLSSIGTLGFRGEALAAIAAVCKMRMISKTAGCTYGSEMICEGGEIIDILESGCPVGTTVTVCELFYNVPARRKFLKKDITEGCAVSAVMEKIAMSAPDISIKYVVDGEVRFMTNGDGELKNVIFSVFGKKTSEKMIPVHRNCENGIVISGYIGQPDLVRCNKNSENFYINNRYIKSRTAMAAVEQAYATRIPSKKFPVCVINIKLNPAIVDVNVHPSKLEVKFADERMIFEAIYYSVLNALEHSPGLPEMDFPFAKQKVLDESVIYKNYASAFVPVERSRENKPENSQLKIVSKQPEPNHEEDELKIKHEECGSGNDDRIIDSSDVNIKNIKSSNSVPVKIGLNKPKNASTDTIRSGLINENNECEDEEIPEYRIIGEAYNCYVILELADRILMVDKHAAHERILFDELCKRMKGKPRRGQMLLFPITVQLNEEERLALNEYSDKICAIGFGYKLNENTGEMQISEIPEEINREAAEDMILKLLSDLSDNSSNIEITQANFFEAKLYQASCKAAIKGGRVYGEQHIKWICDRLLKKPGKDGVVIKTCPHGRPVAFEIKKSSIDRQFDRIN